MANTNHILEPNHVNNYDIFIGNFLEIADRILHRRHQLLIHSCIYYEFNTNLVSDKQWDEWAKELKQLQEAYPEVSCRVMWYDAFKDWDASTGFNLPLKDPWVIQTAQWVLQRPIKAKSKEISKPVSVSKSTKTTKKRLF